MAARPSLLSGFGRVGVPASEHRSEDLESLTADAVLSRGLGRSYGDSSLPPPSRPIAANTTLADRILAFDPLTGVLRAEAGLSVLVLNRLLLPRRFFLPVSPGTQFVTLGGMVAADVHGKNHHRDGCFGAHVLALRMRVADGRIVDCGPERERELFWATVGGMGLTGHILEVSFRMRPIPSPWIWAETERMGDIDAFIDGLKTAARDWPYTMGWIDCLKRGRHLGRGILMRGRWAEAKEAPPVPPGSRPRPRVPFVLPVSAVQPLTVRAFNSIYYHAPRRRRGLQHPEPFFYPLDVAADWNRLYGPRGFTQYQCVLPESAGRGAARRFLERLTRRGGASMLCVIKDCGPEGRGLLSFPKPGISIALDVAITDDTQALVDALNEEVIAQGGRVYLAKDAFTRADHFRAMEPRLCEWQQIRRKWDPEARIRSAQSVRLFGDAP
jgi:decaprenylphospho-beta-D-ribofuranose 2-oxidase